LKFKYIWYFKKIWNKKKYNSINYIFSIRLDTYIKSFEIKWSWRSQYSKQVTDVLHWIELFHNSWKNIFEINNIKLLENNYSTIYDILLPVFKSWWVDWTTKIYYKLVIDFSSPELPDYKKELNINLNKKLIFNSKNNEKLWKIITIWVLILIFLFYIIYLSN
jgi:hypothetical protein